jgi:outer membrane receptor protein involved in Fe transport
MQRLIVLILFFSSITSIAASNVGVVKGTVYDNATNEPLPGANVIYSKNKVTSTDANGNYSFTTTAGDVNVIFRFVGYKMVSKTVHLNANDTIILDVKLIQYQAEIDQVVVSAGKIEQPLSDLTVTLSIIEPRSIGANHITSTEELLNKAPGVEVLDGQASIRSGSGYSYGAGSRVLALIDGLPILAADAGNIRWQFLPLENISQIEIIKGASSVIYGSSALNGVINFRSADAPARPTTNFFIESGIFGTPQRKDWVWWDSPRTFNTASFSRMVKFANTDISIGSYLHNDKGYRKFNDELIGRVNLRIKHNDSYYNGLSYGLNINAGFTQKTDFVLWEDATNGALKQSETTAIALTASSFSFDPFVSFVKHDKYSHDLRVRIHSTSNLFPEAENNNSDAQSIYAEYQTWFKFNPFLSVNIGLSQNYSQILSLFYGNHKGFNIAGFSQFNFNLSQRMRFVAGVRLEHYSLDSQSDKLVPLFRSGLNYRLFDFTFLRASFGQGYRHPSIAEKHATTTLGAVTIFPNTFLEPEHGWSTEVGAKHALEIGSTKGLLDLAFFYSQNKDLIEYVFGSYPEGLGFRATNVEYSRVYGGEFEFMIKKDFGAVSTTFNGGYVYTYPVEFNKFTGLDTDVFLKFRRKHSGNISAYSNYKDYDFGLNIYARSKILNIDDVFLNPVTREDILPGFYDYWQRNNKGHIVFDLSFGYRLTDNFRLSIVAKNLLNKEYMGRPGDIMPHRNISLRVAGNF